MKKTLFLLLLLSAAVGAQASHILGSDIRYAAEGSAYRIYLTIYTDCSGVQAPLTANILGSSGCGLTFSRLLPQVSKDTLAETYCPGAGGCNSGSFPYYIATVYSDTLSLPPCNSWKFGYYECCRNTAIGNILNAGAAGMYVEAFLDNAAAPNSSAKHGNYPPFIIHTNSVNSVPIPTTDVDGDSVVYELVTPMSSTTQTVTYLPGYSAAQPLGGSGVSIDAALQLLKLKSSTIGQYLVALRTKEYRNGQLVGYTQRDWALLNLSTTDSEIPLPAPGSAFVYYTCPGQYNNISLSFNDSTATDSVFVSFEPGVPWSFSTSGGTGVGSATGTISWTTPASVNPSALPYFYIRVQARDNACPVRGIAWYDVLVKVASCDPDSVWPGDADGNYQVNLYDPLAIALAYGETGPSRPGASTAWTAQYCADWTNSFPNGVNHKHADCNGNGTINLFDLGPVITNYGQWHQKGGAPAAKVAGIPDLHFESAGVAITPGAAVSIPLKLGSSALPMNNVYGIAARLKVINLEPAAAPQMSQSGSWIGTTGNTLSFSKSISTTTTDWALARTDHQQVNGSGTIATMDFTVPANAAVGTKVIFRIEQARIIDKNGAVLEQYNVLDDTATVMSATSVPGITGNAPGAVIVPNPSRGEAALWFRLERAGAVSIRVVNAMGQTVRTHQMNGNEQLSQWMLSPEGLAAGMYHIHIIPADGSRALSTRWLLQR